MFDKYNVDPPDGEIGFEGPEKTLNIVFSGDDDDGGEGVHSLRAVDGVRWQQMLELARCKILSVSRGQACDAYVLSESSLFVYDRRVILKTCGTTRLLSALDDIISIGSSCGLSPRALLYCRKCFTFPEVQPAPHSSFDSEVSFLDERFGSSRSSVTVAGPRSADHWCFYFVDFFDDSDSDVVPPFSTFEVKMHEIHPDRAALFYERSGSTGGSVTSESGIAGLIPGQVVDEHLFSPCGYSMNGIFGPHYSTIHVTPEERCSYVSFETSLPLDGSLLAAVVGIFRPATFSVSVIGPAAAVAAATPTAPGYSACDVEAFVLGASLPAVMWSFVATDISEHPLGERSARRLAALARRAAATAQPPPSPVPVSPVVSLPPSPLPFEESEQFSITLPMSVDI